MTELLTAVAIVFIVAGPFLLVANRLDIPAVPFLILAGIVAGVGVDEEITLELAQWGIALLVFSFGLQIQFDAVRVVLGDGEKVAIAQMLSVGLLGVVVGVLFGLPLEQAMYFGIVAAFSSTIVGTALLQRDIRKNLVRGRLAESMNFVQDIAAVLVVLVLGAGAFDADLIAMQVGYGVFLLLAAVFVNRILFDVLERLSKGSDEQLIVSVIALLVVFLGAAELSGISIVVGAFAAGIAVRYDPDEYFGVFDGLVSIRDFFVAIFFVTVGALVTVPTVEVFALAVGLGLLTAVVKPVVTTVFLIYSGYEARSATLTSLSLDQVSEFSLVIVIEALILGILLQSVFDAIIIAAAATMITSSLSRAYDEQIYRVLADWRLFEGRHEKIDERSSVPEDLTDHAIIVGYGRQGRTLVETCERLDIQYVVVENDPTRLEDLRSECDAYVFSDANEPYAWVKADVDEARIIVSTVNSPPVSEYLLRFANGTDLILRTDDVEFARDLLDRGAMYVCVDDTLASEQLIEYIERLEDGSLPQETLRKEQIASLSDLA
ncbi:Kef-type K+ transport system, membrane component [Halalkaliarchaeum desulfuricum]|uniref:Kef-type K+ transport system, membrane component n=1 Tax=Halalkaliarchaeum desulfuricum TaxID=2055893 RepID=A0A343TFR4_9EURY|nr:cation:proton antiporter [Halalkaliarchaeum desulfuricum]AUX07936.1 Kef-type K+ transport system, membrane component [Halalkaliarchaeum desulfuricum]